MSLLAKKVLGVGGAVVLLGVLIGLYVAAWATSLPTAVAPQLQPAPPRPRAAARS